MNAVIETGGKQYTVSTGDKIDIEKLPGNPGDEVNFDKVLMVSDNGDAKIGTPSLEGASVSAKILDQKKGNKITVFKFKRRKGYRRKAGHRQRYTTVQITDINK